MFTPKQKTQLLDAIHRSGMHSDYFTLTETDAELIMAYGPADFNFTVTLPWLKGYLDGEHKGLEIVHSPNYFRDFPNFDEAVIEKVPDWKAVVGIYNGWLTQIKRDFYEQTPHGQAELEQEREMAELIAKTPSTGIWSNFAPAPTLFHLHPAVQAAVGSRFADGYYSDALHKACTALEKAVQRKASQPPEPTGATLMSKVFSKDKPLLTMSTNQGEQEGYMFLYRGLAQAIRNHYAHNDPSIKPARALEWLGFISALFYKLDEAQPTAVPSMI